MRMNACQVSTKSDQLQHADEPNLFTDGGSKIPVTAVA
jgi:hypothetical protein